VVSVTNPYGRILGFLDCNYLIFYSIHLTYQICRLNTEQWVTWILLLLLLVVVVVVVVVVIVVMAVLKQRLSISHTHTFRSSAVCNSVTICIYLFVVSSRCH
jgi:heme/copper-type cytochrome/quinol oxidase subunit 2